MILYLYDSNGFFIGEQVHDKGTALPKCGFTHIPPVDVSDGKVAMFADGAWIESAVPSGLIPVVIESVAGQLEGYTNAGNEYTVPQNSADVIATGQLAVPDRKFKVPFKRTDTGRIQLMPAEVVAGQFTIPLNFETNGVWVVNQELINSDFPEPMFELAEYRFSVI